MNGQLIFAMLMSSILSLLSVFPAMGRASAAEQTVLATTFPIYQLVRNVTQGREGVKVDLLLPSQAGCPHDYALTPRDMQKLAKADILVVNGLGMEEFLGAPVKKATPRIRVIDSSTGIKEILHYAGEQSHDHGHGHNHAAKGHHADGKGVEPVSRGPESGHAHHHEEAGQEHGHYHHAGVNPHLFASPRMTAELAMNIAAELSKADPGGAGIYFRNARACAETMNRLADDMSALGKRLKNNRIVQPHGVFDYLARDMGVEIVAVLRAHGQEPSASEMMQLVKTIREKHAGAIFTEPQYPEKVGKAL
ncbi:MAG: zinc ABC transporter substrate-binding protein, partial [Syntrophobacteraceae bacterium]